MLYDTKKMRLTLQLRNQEWEGRDKQTAIEHVLTCHSVTRLSFIALLSKSGCILKHRHVLILSRKMSDCKSERVSIKFLVRLKKFATETFQFWLRFTGKTACLMHVCLNGTNDFRKPGHPCTAVANDNIEKVRDVIRKDRRLGVRAVAEEVNLYRESVWRF
jgi:hypothetical protein